MPTFSSNSWRPRSGAYTESSYSTLQWNKFSSGIYTHAHRSAFNATQQPRNTTAATLSVSDGSDYNYLLFLKRRTFSPHFLVQCFIARPTRAHIWHTAEHNRVLHEVWSSSGRQRWRLKPDQPWRPPDQTSGSTGHWEETSWAAGVGPAPPHPGGHHKCIH